MPPMTHTTKVVFPSEKDEQEKLVAAFTQEKKGWLRFRYEGSRFDFGDRVPGR